MARFAVVLGAFLLAGCNSFLAQAPSAPEASAIASNGAPNVIQGVAPVDPAMIATAPVADLDCAPSGGGRNISCE